MEQQDQLPGYRFKPTDDELVLFYLRPKALGETDFRGTISDVDVYKFEPWDLPGKSNLPMKDQEWYFFSVQDRKYSHSARVSRTTKKGYWKATGRDCKVYNVFNTIIGSKKSLVYYEGRAPNGCRTNWIMHEYRLDEEFERKENIVCAVVLCRIRKKQGPEPRNGGQDGAPVLNEGGELEEVADTGKVDDSPERGSWAVESKCEGNVYNLKDQAEMWKLSARQMGSPSVRWTDLGTAHIASESTNIPGRKETLACDPGFEDVWQFILDTACFNKAPDIHEHHGCPIDLQRTSLFIDSDKPSVLPSCSDADGRPPYDYKSPGFDEYDMIREMAGLVKDDQGDVLPGAGLEENLTVQTQCYVPLGGDFIELNDMEDPFYGYALWAPVESSELGNVEEKGLFKAMPENFEEIQDMPYPQRLAAHRDRSQSPGASERLKAATVFPQAELGSHGGRFTSSKEVYRNAGGRNNSDSVSGENDSCHLVQSSNRSYLSKHVATHTILKHEMVPAQLCYALSFTERQNHGSATALPVESKRGILVEAVSIIPATPIDTQSPPPLLINPSNSIERDVSETLLPTLASSGYDLPSSSDGSGLDVEEAPLASASQSCESRAESATINSPRRHRWKRPLRGLVSKVKGSVLGARIVELESGMRAKLNDKLSALGKSAARVAVMPAEHDVSAYDCLRMWVVATLCRLVAAVLIFFCVFWGPNALVSYAFGVSV